MQSNEKSKAFQPFTKKRKLGYAFGIFTESLPYNMFYTYFLTFLVQIVGVKPALSGAIIFLSIAWDAITDPIIGAYTDRDGIDKRKVMKKAILPLGIVFALSWLNWGSITGTGNPVVLAVIYIVLTMSVWIFYTFYTIPYYSVVAEITEDYDERTSIRSLSSLVNALAIALGNVLPALVTTVVFGHAVTYFDTSVLVSVLAVGLGFLAVACLSKIYLPKAEAKPLPKAKQNNPLKETFAAFKDIIRLKPFKFFIVFVFFFLFATSMIQSSFTYTVVYCIGMEYDAGIVIVVISLVATIAAVTPLAERLAKKTDRRTSCLLFFTICCVGLFVLKLIGLDVKIGNFPVMTVILPVVAGIGLGAFWTLFYSMAYDFVEIDEFVSGKRRESLITAFPQLIQKFGSGTGILTQGLLLTAYGYVKSAGDYENVFEKITDARVLEGMENITTLFPALLLIISIIGLLLLPTTRTRLTLLSGQLDLKRNGKKYSADGLEKLI